MEWRRSPAAGLAAVITLIYVNQLLFTIYVLREHDGDPSFIAQHLPEGWFTLARGPVLELLAQHFPAPELLAPSVLRVNAFLELPFVVFSYLTACRWFSPERYAKSLVLVWPMSVSYTATFCLIEWRLYNEYTVDDIVIRTFAAVVVPLWVARISRTGSPGRTDNLPGMLVFAASTAGLGLLVLVVYDTALLYNLGHLDTQVPIATVGLVMLVAARWAAPRIPDWPPGRGIDAMARSSGWLLVLAAVPALPIRYGLNFGARYLSVAGALVLFGAAAGLGIRDVFGQRPGQPARLLLQMTVAAIVGLCGAASSLPLNTEHTEARLLIAGAAGFLGTISVCAYLDRRTGELDAPTSRGYP